VLNPIRETREVMVRLTALDAGLRGGEDVWQGQPVTVDGNMVKVTVGDRDAAVIHLQ
jgi:hypothetical protein